MAKIEGKRIQKDQLEQFVRNVFIEAGLDERQSTLISRHLVLANLRGMDSHGVSRVSIYCKRLDLGLVDKTYNPIIEKESEVSALINANNSSGIPVSTFGIELAIKKAKKSGIGIVAIHNSNHCGMLADYVQRAVEEDCIVLATTNAPANMAPWGGKSPFFGTNPFAYGIPTGEEDNIVLDMATSKVAKGKVVLAQKNNQNIPIGWALSSDGQPTEDPNEALKGVFLPFGEHKGYGITFLVETLSAIVTGSAFGPHIGDLYTNFENKQNVGQFFYCMRADLFQDIDKFKSRMDQMIKEIRTVPVMKGVDKIYLPGEIENITYKDRSENGIPLSKEIIHELQLVGEKYNLSLL
ncbi:Ldh family oxidoreductase [Bacillus sp. PS06]|uniref:Ldh family oxidoreductase n=1 Tax=Bacillus sp. PS06 TaxID=2764176 RepID=UPI0017850C2F|nr:Ldh family oxidoreductase [Bacillus sp. PS06]MBD8067937.1 Ldh family oxidoreductase [Bacillus sp. PS06]